MSTVVFVGNIQYEATEENLIRLFEEAGGVVAFRMIFDKETCQSKGYGFCQFHDHQTALEAVHKFHLHEFCGRPLRVVMAELDPTADGMSTDPRSPPYNYSSSSQNRREHRGDTSNGSKAVLSRIRRGAYVPFGTNSVEFIERLVGSMRHQEVLQVLSHSKAFIITHPNEARELFAEHPQLKFALVQALQRCVPSIQNVDLSNLSMNGGI